MPLTLHYLFLLRLTLLDLTCLKVAPTFSNFVLPVSCAEPRYVLNDNDDDGAKGQIQIFPTHLRP